MSHIMIDKIANLEKASADIRNYFKSILEGRLLSIDVDNISDEELLSSLPDGVCAKNQGLRFVNNLCSWITIGETREQVFGKPYQQIHLITGEELKEPYYINYSMFRYPLEFNREKYVIFANRSGISTIDDKVIDPGIYFQKHYGEKLFFICAITGVDIYGLKKACYYFAKEKIDPLYIRRYILEAQVAALIEISHKSVEYGILPLVDMIRELPDRNLNFQTTSTHSKVGELAIKIYNEEFFSYFKSKYEKILKNYYDFCKQHKEIMK